MTTVHPVLAIVGPTASGKSELALDVAQRIGAEIVNADAMQLYQGMDIGTAKLSPEERRGIPHHQLDVLDIRAEASVTAYQRRARADIAQIHARGRSAIVVGGSGLYVRAVLDRLEIPPTDSAVRARLQSQLEHEGVERLHRRLTSLDPPAGAAIESNNGRRIVRALEVIELTGRPFSATMPHREYLLSTRTIGLSVERPVLDGRIERRVHRMWEQGLLAEVHTLLRQGLRDGRTASRAVGYSQAVAHLDGRMTAAQAQDETVTATRRLARRQESWFGPDPRITWLPHDASDLLDRTLALVDAAG